ncbi:MAG: hypothetical protein QM727_08770 [Niabella sp.]
MGSRAEQFIDLMHTKNIKPNWNVFFRYRMINTPGFFKSQNANHNNYMLTSWYQSENKRYNNYFVIAANKLQSAENGGIVDTTNYMDDPMYSERFRVPTYIGGDAEYSTSFFNTSIKTGNRYNTTNVVLRQQYDLGKKDSLVTDSTVIPLFFPRIRLEHTINYGQYRYNFKDPITATNDFYKEHYNMVPDTVSRIFYIQDKWRELTNDFSIYTFPEAKNTQQFLKVGAAYQSLQGTLDSLKTSEFNIIGHGEYRNRTRNKKWDMLAAGRFYFAGMNAGDYDVTASVESLLGRKIGSLKLGFQNTNRTPSFISSDTLSSFYLLKQTIPIGNTDDSVTQKIAINLNKENITHLYAEIYQPLLKLSLSAHYYLVNNYVYYTDYYKINQAGLFNVLRISASKVFETGRKKQWKWYADVHFQQTIGNAAVQLPTIFTRHRFAYEGSLGFPNLNLAAGLEAKYRTSYKANGYSPVLGQFFYQNEVTPSYKMPDITAFVHFRIKSFKMFIRAENLNTFGKVNSNWGWLNNNYGVPGYPYPGFILRLGVFWGFVN